MKRRGARIAAALAAALLASGIGLAVGLAGGGHSGHERSQTTSATTPTGASPGPPAQPAPATTAFGVNVNRLFEDPRFAPVLETQLAALAATGATLARSDALWEATEPVPPTHGVHHYDWSFDDRVAGALAAHGLRWLAVLDYSVSWAQSVPGQDHSPPARSADYAAYAAAFANRYGPQGSFWAAHPSLSPRPVDTIEVWNEPDNPVFWFPRPNAGAYAELYQRTRAAVAAVRPSIRVIVGGLQHPLDFLPALLRARPDLAGHTDGVGVHPYAHTPGEIIDRVRADRGVMTRIGLGAVPLYVTELGWTTSPPGTHDYLLAERRPAALTFALAGLGHLACGLGAVTVYTWVTAEQNPADGEEWYGIAPPGGGSSPDVRGFAAGVRAATAAGRTIPCSAS